jgi:hypothetical protein
LRGHAAGSPDAMDRKLLAIYLNDHLAGSVVGENLAKRIARQNEGNEYGRKVGEIAREIKEDQATLLDIMRRAGVRRKQIRLAMARVAEPVTRLKPNGRLIGYSPLSRVLELEGLIMGITGKLEMWRSLQAIENGSRIGGVDFDLLAAWRRTSAIAEEDLRLKARREALRGHVPISFGSRRTLRANAPGSAARGPASSRGRRTRRRRPRFLMQAHCNCSVAAIESPRCVGIGPRERSLQASGAPWP